MKEFSKLLNESRDIFGVDISQSEMQLLESFADQMAESNDKYNLSGIKEPEDIRKKHFLDSISCIPSMGEIISGKAIDIGTGAGFPGLVIKILRPGIDFTLVDSVGKKTAFIDQVCEQLKLDSVATITDRVEILGQDHDHRERYDLVFARALAKMPVMVEYLLPLAKVGGIVIAQRGSDSRQEVKDYEPLIERLGGEVVEIIPIEIPEMTERYIIKIKKFKPTPRKYPRRVGVPKKNPLQNI